MFEGPGDQKGQGAKIGGHIGFQGPGEGGERERRYVFMKNPVFSIKPHPGINSGVFNKN